VQQLEQEVKLEVEPGWALPDLTGLFPGVRAVPMPALALDAVYYDTAGSHLAKRHITLRFRREAEAGTAGTTRAGNGRATGIWTIKLPSSTPSDGTVLVRTELTWPAVEGKGDGGDGGDARPRQRRRRPAGPPPLPPHPEAARFLQAVTLGLPLVPVAQLSTTRERTELRTSDGRNLAEIDHDSVTGRALPPPGEAPTGAGGGPGADHEIRFVELEVELAEGSAQEVLDAVAHRLRLAGARPSARQSKLATVLRMASLASPALPGLTPTSDGTPERRGRGARRAHALMSDALSEQARECLDAVLDHDPAIRLGDPDPEHVHQARVGARRLRSVLRSFAPLVATPLGELDGTPETWFAELRDELKWLGGALGAVRDADVRLQGLVEECSALPSADNTGAATLLAAAEDDQRQAHDALLEAMATERYVELLRSLDALASEACPPPGQLQGGPVPGPQPPGRRVPTGLSARLAQPAASGLPALALHQWRAVRKAVRGLGDEPPDTALHQVRIQAKRLRYLSEVAALFVAPAAHRDAAKRTGKAAAHLQDVLGELHDAAVSEQWLRSGSTRVPSRTRTAVVFASGLAAGELVARAQQRQRALRKKWPAAWAPLGSRELHAWMLT
jgi:CHAD domain-containing protein